MCVEINLLDIFDDVFQIIGTEMYVIAYEQRGCSKAGHDLDPHEALFTIKKYVVAAAAFTEMMHQIIHDNLYVVCYRINGFIGFRNNIEFTKTNARAGGDVELNPILFMDRQADKIFGIIHEVIIDIVESYDLHMGMAHGAAR